MITPEDLKDPNMAWRLTWREYVAASCPNADCPVAELVVTLDPQKDRTNCTPRPYRSLLVDPPGPSEVGGESLLQCVVCGAPLRDVHGTYLMDIGVPHVYGRRPPRDATASKPPSRPAVTGRRVRPAR